MKHKTLLVYVPCLDGGCEDIGRIELDGHTLVSDERLWDLEAAESDGLEQARLNGIGAERELALMARIERLEKERDAMRAKVAEMEKQEPVATVIKKGADRYWMSERLGEFHDGTYPLYALPGAKGEDK